jgi:hypothetical protein
MKMLCIRGAAPRAPWHDGLVFGEQYDVEYWNCSCGQSPRALAVQCPFRRGSVGVVCSACGIKNPLYFVPWGRDRFVKWDPPTVSKKEVAELYSPGINETQKT